jgi:putative spermidine/putrescine transport system ATP-binding protein
MADSLAVFNEGRIAQIGTPEQVYTRPATRFVADFVGSSNVLPPDLTERIGGPSAWASLRPEALRIADGGPMSGRVTTLRYLGAGTRAVVDVGGTDVGVFVPAGQSVPQPGAQVSLAFAPTDLHVMRDG